MEKNFCQNCKQLIPAGNMLKPSTAIEFEDGLYCGPCAASKVKKART